MKTTPQQVGAIVLFMGIPLLLTLIPKEVDTSEDGIYCADIQYYNPSTGTESFYTLPVEIEDEQVIKIKFNNGGWLDESHFEREVIWDGEAKIITDENVEYTIKLLNNGDCE